MTDDPVPPHEPPAPDLDGEAPAREEGRPQGARRLGRRIVAVLFLSFVSIWVVWATGPIVREVLFPEAAPPPWATCRDGQLALHEALQRAVLAAQGDDDVDEALRRFRGALTPEWAELEGTRALCEGVESDRRGLDALERLRYAEEHAVRREASSLAALRRQVAASLGRSAGERPPPEGNPAITPPPPRPAGGPDPSPPR